MESIIPVVDFHPCSLETIHKDIDKCMLKQTGEQICKAFHEVGFVYLKNHGIPQKQIDDAFHLVKVFTELPEDVKRKYMHTENGQGWVAMAQERLNQERPHDLKESYSYIPQYAEEFPDPSQHVSGFNNAMSGMFEMSHKLAMRILEAIGLGLNLEDPHYFCKAHNPYTRNCLTALRALYYPPIKDSSAVEPMQIRCGEHSDWGSITLLFQDQTGGLEVMSKGEFKKAVPIPGTIIVNIGDLMQRWSGDYFTSTVHRVVIPDDESRLSKGRQSIAFFANPDDDCDIISLKTNYTAITDNKPKYERILGHEDKSNVHRVVMPADQLLLLNGRQSIAFFAIPDDDCDIISIGKNNDVSPDSEPIKTREYMDMKMKAALY